MLLINGREIFQKKRADKGLSRGPAMELAGIQIKLEA
jgi:hypothetical protein